MGRADPEYDESALVRLYAIPRSVRESIYRLLDMNMCLVKGFLRGLEIQLVAPIYPLCKIEDRASARRREEALSWTESVADSQKNDKTSPYANHREIIWNPRTPYVLLFLRMAGNMRMVRS